MMQKKHLSGYRGLVVSNLLLETKGSRFESGGSSPAASYVQMWAVWSNRPADV